MGKKKSVVLMVIITIILVALTVFSVAPSFWFPWNDGLKGWNAVTAEFIDFGSDYEGGYYAYYYPEGVISEAQYKDNLESLNDDDKAEYEERFIRHGGLYLDTEAEFITEGNEISDDFKAEIEKFKDVVSARYQEKGYSQYTVSVVDHYAIRVEVPASDANYADTMQAFAQTGELTLKLNGEVVDELSDEEASASQFIKKFSMGTKFAYKFVHVKLTKAGADLINRLEEAGSIVSQSADTTYDGKTGLWIYLGDTPMLPVYTENIASDDVLKCAHNEAKAAGYLQTRIILMNSALENGGFSFAIEDVNSEMREMDNVYGKNSVTAILIFLAAVTVLAIAVAIVRCKRYGIVFGYMACSYLSIVALCFAFITARVFEFTLGSAIIYVLGLLVMLLLHCKHYDAIKNEVAQGKTVNSAVTLGYKKSLWLTVDVYVVLALSAFALLIGLAGVATLAWQTLICVAAAAFCNLLWGRVINYTYLSASKDKYKYFGFVREDDEDDE